MPAFGFNEKTFRKVKSHCGCTNTVLIAHISGGVHEQSSTKIGQRNLQSALFPFILQTQPTRLCSSPNKENVDLFVLFVPDQTVDCKKSSEVRDRPVSFFHLLVALSLSCSLLFFLFIHLRPTLFYGTPPTACVSGFLQIMTQ